MKRASLILILISGSAWAASAKKDLERQALESFAAKKPYQLAQAFDLLGFSNLATASYYEAAAKTGKEAVEGLFRLADANDDTVYLDYVAENEAAKTALAGSSDAQFRLGERLLAKGKLPQAIQVLGAVSPQSRRYFKARYLQAIAMLKSNQAADALARLKVLNSERDFAPATDYNWNVAALGIARIHYKRGEWDKALEYYRMIPKDSGLWHQALMESGWTHFRRGDFREVLSGLSSVHSPFYEDYFVVESVLLRSFVYLSICSLDEMDKTLKLFSHMFFPLKEKLSSVLNISRYSELYAQVEQALQAVESRKGISVSEAARFTVPLPLARELAADPEFKRAYKMVKSLRGELERLDKTSKEFKESQLTQVSMSYLKGRLSEAVKFAGKRARAFLMDKQKEMDSLFRQYDFAKYEMVAANKQEIKRGGGPRSTTVDDVDREYFLSKGIEYYTFRGEFWIDEIGNTHFIGRSWCK